jgi:hypothetical protein
MKKPKREGKTRKVWRRKLEAAAAAREAREGRGL